LKQDSSTICWSGRGLLRPSSAGCSPGGVNAERRLNLFSEVAIAIVRGAVLLAGTLTVMLIADVRITSIVFGFALPIFALALWFVRWMRRYYVRVRQSVAELSTFVTEFVPAVPILQVFGRESWALKRLEAKSNARYRAELASEQRDYAFWSFLATVEVSAVMLILYLGFGSAGGAHARNARALPSVHPRLCTVDAVAGN
jgi:ABC-type multidrug transport system fused ATPase/permease subunit